MYTILLFLFILIIDTIGDDAVDAVDVVDAGAAALESALPGRRRCRSCWSSTPELPAS